MQFLMNCKYCNIYVRSPFISKSKPHSAIILKRVAEKKCEQLSDPSMNCASIKLDLFCENWSPSGSTKNGCF